VGDGPGVGVFVRVGQRVGVGGGVPKGVRVKVWEETGDSVGVNVSLGARVAVGEGLVVADGVKVRVGLLAGIWSVARVAAGREVSFTVRV